MVCDTRRQDGLIEENTEWPVRGVCKRAQMPTHSLYTQAALHSPRVTYDQPKVSQHVNRKDRHNMYPTFVRRFLTRNTFISAFYIAHLLHVTLDDHTFASLSLSLLICLSFLSCFLSLFTRLSRDNRFQLFTQLTWVTVDARGATWGCVRPKYSSPLLFSVLWFVSPLDASLSLSLSPRPLVCLPRHLNYNVNG